MLYYDNNVHIIIHPQSVFLSMRENMNTIRNPHILFLHVKDCHMHISPHRQKTDTPPQRPALEHAILRKTV